MMGTILRTTWPPLMWRRIRMSHELSPGRLAAYLVTSLAMLYLVFALSHGWTVWHSWNTQVNAVNMPATPTTAGWPVFAQASAFPWSSRSIGTYTTTGGWKGANSSLYIGEEGDPDNRSGWWNVMKDSFIKAYRAELGARMRKHVSGILAPAEVAAEVDKVTAKANPTEAMAAPVGLGCSFPGAADSFKQFAIDRKAAVEQRTPP